MDHHALLFIGTHDDVFACIPESYRVRNVDTHHISCSRFGINEARSLKETASNRPIQESKRRFVIETNEILREAQNALLKLFEDPPETAQFLVILPHERNIIPTLRSRFHIVTPQVAPSTDDVFPAFKNMSYSQRLTEISRKVQSKDTEWIHEILNGIEHSSNINTQKNPTLIRDILQARTYIDTRGASPKMILEHIALTLPTAGHS